MTLLHDLREAFAAGGTMWNTRAYAEARNAEARVRLNALAVRVRAGELGGPPDSFPLYAGSWATLLVGAIGRGSVSLASALLDVGANPNARHVNDFDTEDPRFVLSDSPLSDAVRACPGVVQRLLELGADPNPNDGTELPLHCAVRAGNADMVRLLLAAGADPLALDEAGRGVLNATRGRVDAECEELIRAAALPRLQTRRGASVRVRRGAAPHTGLERWLRSAMTEDDAFLILFRRGDAASLASALSRTVGGGSEGGAHKRWIPETGAHYYGVIGFRDREWAVALIEHWRRFDANRGIYLAEALSQESELIVLLGATAFRYQHGHVVEQRSWWPGAVQQASTNLEAEERELARACIAWCENLGLVVPRMSFASDGFCVGVDVEGIKKADIDDAWIVWDPVPPTNK